MKSLREKKNKERKGKGMKKRETGHGVPQVVCRYPMSLFPTTGSVSAHQTALHQGQHGSSSRYSSHHVAKYFERVFGTTLVQNVWRFGDVMHTCLSGGQTKDGRK
jgi:hypothetical protein